MDLSAQHGGQQGHTDVHAVLCLAEVGGPRVCVHLHTVSKTRQKERIKRNNTLAFYATKVL